MENSTLAKSLKVLDRFVEDVEALKLPRLSPEYQHLPAAQLKEALVAHRIRAKYEVPNSEAAALRKTASINAVLEHDKRGPDDFDWRGLPSAHRNTFLHACNSFKIFFKGFAHTYKLRFPSGETFVSSKGLTDLYFKLSQEEQWKVSPDLVDYCVEILLRERALLNVVRHRYRQKYGRKGVGLLRRLWAYWSTNDIPYYNKRKAAIRFMFKRCVTYTRASRITTVPKDNKSDRVITCEALWTMVCQLSYGHSLRCHLRKRLGVDLDFLQNVHRALIRSGAATIDLSKASDSNYMVILDQLWPKSQTKWLRRMRTGIFVRQDEGEDVYTPLKMFAPMGCGCTFEVMTLTLLLQARVFDKGASVFGDDIIISQKHASEFIDYLVKLHWHINEDKSFIKGNFRESCGAFAALDTQELLLSYDFRRPENLKEVYILAHKMCRLVRYLPKGQVLKTLNVAYRQLLFILPRVSWVLETEWAHVQTASLRDDVIHVEKHVFRALGKVGETPISRLISEYWQREVRVNRQLRDVPIGVTLPDNPIGYASFLKRGRVYEPTKRTIRRQYPIDAETGTMLNSVVLATVLT